MAHLAGCVIQDRELRLGQYQIAPCGARCNPLRQTFQPAARAAPANLPQDLRRCAVFDFRSRLFRCGGNILGGKIEMRG
ncbi:MAG: hypothetical protein OEV15_10565, partial [Gallionella sp.]|nr:hypothetical protein [Gallionella sp.]